MLDDARKNRMEVADARVYFRRRIQSSQLVLREAKNKWLARTYIFLSEAAETTLLVTNRTSYNLTSLRHVFIERFYMHIYLNAMPGGKDLFSLVLVVVQQVLHGELILWV